MWIKKRSVAVRTVPELLLFGLGKPIKIAVRSFLVLGVSSLVQGYPLTVETKYSHLEAESRTRKFYGATLSKESWCSFVRLFAAHD